MANTYNTAFGALPSTKSIYGNRQPTAANTGAQQYAAQLQSARQQQKQAAPQQTFAQMQQQGVARPAPQMAPAMSQQQPQMMGQLQAQLSRQPQVPAAGMSFFGVPSMMVDQDTYGGGRGMGGERQTDGPVVPPPTDRGVTGGAQPPTPTEGMIAVPPPTPVVSPVTSTTTGGGAQPPTPPTGGFPTGGGGFKRIPSVAGGIDVGILGGVPEFAEYYRGTPEEQALQRQMLGNISRFLSQPTRYDTDLFRQLRDVQAQNIAQEFGGIRQQLEEQLAGRGLASSSIGAGRLGDVAVQQSRALAELDAGLLREAAMTQAQDNQAAIEAGLASGRLTQQQAESMMRYEMDKARITEETNSRITSNNLEIARLEQQGRFEEARNLQRQNELLGDIGKSLAGYGYTPPGGAGAGAGAGTGTAAGAGAGPATGAGAGSNLMMDEEGGASVMDQLQNQLGEARLSGQAFYEANRNRIAEAMGVSPEEVYYDQLESMLARQQSPEQYARLVANPAAYARESGRRRDFTLAYGQQQEVLRNPAMKFQYPEGFSPEEFMPKDLKKDSEKSAWLLGAYTVPHGSRVPGRQGQVLNPYLSGTPEYKAWQVGNARKWMVGNG